jgi:predicted nuclease with TOPRIM domain
MIDPGYLIGAGGLLAAIGGAVIAFRKAGPESGKLLVDAAKDVVLIQKGAMDDLRQGLADAQKEIARLREEITGCTTLRNRVATLEAEIEELMDERRKLRAENTRLRGRVKTLEQEVATLKENSNDG